jgi:hypothetical protein
MVGDEITGRWGAERTALVVLEAGSEPEYLEAAMDIVTRFRVLTKGGADAK